VWNKLKFWRALQQFLINMNNNNNVLVSSNTSNNVISTCFGAFDVVCYQVHVLTNACNMID